MTTFKLTLEMNNAAFVDAGEANEPIRLRDVNGNTVGNAETVG